MKIVVKLVFYLKQCCCNFDNYDEEVENLIDKCVEKGGNYYYIKK